MRVAVGVGSRGISNLKEIVEATIRVLMAAGAQPFIIPAMGSHGGATPDGQTKVLVEYGIAADSLGVPIDADMEVKRSARLWAGGRSSSVPPLFGRMGLWSSIGSNLIPISEARWVVGFRRC